MADQAPDSENYDESYNPVNEPEGGETGKQITYVVSDLPSNYSVRLTRDFSATRNLLAIVIAVGYTITTLLVVFGGLIGIFGLEIVDPVAGALAASATAVAYFFFRQRRQ